MSCRNTSCMYIPIPIWYIDKYTCLIKELAVEMRQYILQNGSYSWRRETFALWRCPDHRLASAAVRCLTEHRLCNKKKSITIRMAPQVKGITGSHWVLQQGDDTRLQMGNIAKDGWDGVQGAVMWGSGAIIPRCPGDMMDALVARSSDTGWREIRLRIRSLLRAAYLLAF